jgi:peptidoglycan/xylan/chitin deacetylase (PgdA/CDA1 family)
VVQLARRAAVAVADAPLVRETLQRVAARDPGRPDQLAVLTYHRVAEPDDGLYPGLISATPREFGEQMAWLAGRYRVITLAQLLERRDDGDPLPARSVLITFDDAYADFAAHAWPVLQRLGLPATLFVPTAYVDDPRRAFWWDRIHRVLSTAPAAITATPLVELDLRSPASRSRSARRLREALKALPHDAAMAGVDDVVDALGGDAASGCVLSWTDLQGLVAQGLEVGVHTRTHPLLDQLSPDRLDDEIAGARDDIERHLGRSATTIAYPNGNHSPAVVEAASRAGMRLGFTTRRGTNDLRDPDWLTLRRINVGRSTSRALLAAQLHRWFRLWP